MRNEMLFESYMREKVRGFIDEIEGSQMKLHTTHTYLAIL